MRHHFSILALSLCALMACVSKTKNAQIDYGDPLTVVNADSCPHNYDSAMRYFVANFHATTFELSENLSPALDSFLMHVDSTCLRQQNSYQYFVSGILLKLYLYHIEYAHQGYDIQFSPKRGAEVLVREYKRMAGYDRRHWEMINSGTVVEFVNKTPGLKNDIHLKPILQKIDSVASQLNRQYEAQGIHVNH